MTASSTALRHWPAIARKMSGALDQPWLAAIMRKSAVEDSLSGLHPMLSLEHVRARVVRVLGETADTKTFVLQANALWTGAQSGQFIRVRVEIDGRMVERVYSLSSRGGARRLAFTVKRQAGGLVSTYLHTHVKAGQVITISQAAGEFILPAQLPDKILLLGAGSGVTPLISMLRELQARGYRGDVVLLQVCRTQEERIFASQLKAMASAFPALRMIIHVTQSQGRLHPDALLRAVPDLGERAAWLCGPSGLMDWVHRMWEANQYQAPLQSERFAAPRLLPSADAGTPVSIALTRSGKHFDARGPDALLMQAERAGFTPKHGCRIGICRSCQCVKKSGTVENLLTGEASSAPDELIRLCISRARSDVALDL